jgi:hypothetical protein
MYLLNRIRAAREVWVVDDKRKSVVVYRVRQTEITMSRQAGEFLSSYGDLRVHVDDLFE